MKKALHERKAAEVVKREYKNIIIPKAVWKRLKEIALQEETTMIQVIGNLVETYDRNERQKKKPSMAMHGRHRVR